MRYPAMGKNARNAVNVPAFSGGVNFGDALNLVDDNQMTDCKNVWYKDGVLQTRPGIESKFYYQMGNIPPIFPNIKIQKNMVTIDDVEYKLAVTIDGTTMNIFCLSPEKKDLEGTPFHSKELYADFTEETLPDSYVFYNGKTTKENGKGLYMLVSRIAKSKKDGTVVAERKVVELYELVGNEFKPLTAEEYYSPIVMINGKGESYSTLPTNAETEYAPSSLFEGHSEFYKTWNNFYFTTDGVSTSFAIPMDLTFCKIQIEYTNYKTQRKHVSGVLNNQNNPLGSSSIDFSDYEITVYPYEKTVNIVPKVNKAPLPSSLGFLANNLLIKVRPYMPNDNEIYDEKDHPFESQQITVVDSNLYGCTISTSFGGSADGIYGGTRTFLSGIKKGDNRNMIAWSGLNEPTYFSENNNTHIGEKVQRITALEKQDNMLVIYKYKSLYYSFYSAGESYTKEDVLSGKVTDVSTLNAQFPIIQINDKLGCDLPNTIQLCGDRLVWACTDNNVYMLRSANQYSTVNVSKISHMLGNKLELSVLDATATTYDGFYMLKSGNKMYLMNYDQYYFNSLPSYSDTKKAGRKMQWFIWELPDIKTSAAEFISDAESLALLVYIKRGNGVQPFIWDFTKGVGEDGYHLEDGTLITLPIESVIQTKMFDFGAMERFKSIEQMYVGFGEVEGETSIQYLTDSGTLDKGVVEINSNGDMQSPEFIKTKRFLPGIKRALRFGMRLTAKGQVKLGGILIKFKYMGATR